MKPHLIGEHCNHWYVQQLLKKEISEMQKVKAQEQAEMDEQTTPGPKSGEPG